jgi:hypothetical protein
MPHINRNRRNPAGATWPATAAVLALLLACLGLAACGGSSKGSSTSANAAAASASASGAPTGPTGPRAGRFKALRECLQKNGISPPSRTPGARRPPGIGGFLGGAGGPQLPKGVTRAQYEAAIKKCGGGAFAGGAGGRLKNPAYTQALAKFATCMRENGVNVPAPNTSGNGPIFNTKGLNTKSSQFKTAETKCSSDLRTAFPARPGAGAGPPGAGGATTPGA